MTSRASRGSSTVDISIDRAGSVLIVSVRGDLDLDSTPVMRTAIDDALAEAMPSAVIIDLTGVAFLSSTGMTVLIDTHRRLDPSTDLAVVSNGPAVTRPLMLVGLDEMFSLHTDVDAALASVST